MALHLHQGLVLKLTNNVLVLIEVKITLILEARLDTNAPYTCQNICSLSSLSAVTKAQETCSPHLQMKLLPKNTLYHSAHLPPNQGYVSSLRSARALPNDYWTAETVEDYMRCKVLNSYTSSILSLNSKRPSLD